MIALMLDMPDNVLGFTASGEVTRQDYEKIVYPAIDTRLKEQQKLRVLFRLGPDFQRYSLGAFWDDLKLGLSHLRSWEKIALVTDNRWIQRATWLLRLVPARVKAVANLASRVKIFGNDELGQAREWVAA